MAGSGTALVSFADFVAATGPGYVTEPTYLINDATRETHYFGRLLDPSVSAAKHISGGESINEKIHFQGGGTFQTYKPGQTQSWVNPQRLKRIEAQWRHTIAHMTWVDNEILNNELMMDGRDDVRAQQYVSLRNEKRQLAMTDMYEGLEDLLWAEPDYNSMEVDTGTEPYSIPAFVNIGTNGYHNTTWSTGGTMEGISAAASDVNSKWQPQTQTYTGTSITSGTNILNAFDRMSMKVRFVQPTMFSQYFTADDLRRQMILTSREGRAAVQDLLRQSQDLFVAIAGGQDPAYPDPQFHGIPIEYVATLDTATLYDDGSDFVAEADATIAAPNFYFINGSFLYPVFHKYRFFEQLEPSRHHTVPDTWVVPIMVWYNLFCTSRKRQGIVSATQSAYY